MISVDQVASTGQVRAAQELVAEYMAWTVTLGVDPAEAPTFDAFAAEVRALPEAYAPPGGALLLASSGGAAAGCVALKRIDAATGELKRLCVRPAWRGQGVGRRLVDEVLDRAGRAG